MVKHALIALVAFAALLPACSAAPAKRVDYVPNTGNRYVDAFVISVQNRNEQEVETQISEFLTISGLYPQYKTAGEYLAWIEECKILRVAQYGSDSTGEPVAIDRSLTTGPRAARTSFIYWITWDCPKGKFRQALNADFKAPKLLVAEMLPPTREIPVMRPPVGP